MRPAHFLVLLLAVSLVASAGAATTVAGARQSTCGQQVTHDLRTAAAVDAFNRSGELRVRAQNTLVHLVDASGFVRLRVENPNGYCVSFRVVIDRAIVDPATLGTVDANNGSVAADWRAEQNLTTGALYTVVETTLPAATTATFAPSEARIMSLKWTGKAEEAGGTVASWVSGLWSDAKEVRLQQRQYTIEPNGNHSIVTVSKTGPEGARIDGWRATYTVGDETHPVDQDSQAPVYYTETAEEIRFMFNNEQATVQFTANPTTIDRVGWRWDAAVSALDNMGDLWPFASTLPGGIAA